MNSPKVINSMVAAEETSAGNLIAIAFPKSPSRAYSETVALAQRAKFYGEFYLGTKLYHSAVFGLDQTQASYAYMVVKAARDWKGTKFFTHGRILTSNYQVEDVVACYLDSFVPKDHRAHCHYIHSDLSGFKFGRRLEGRHRHLVPCRKLQGFAQHIVEDNVSTPGDAITQLAIRRNVYWCPHFKPEDYKKSVGYKDDAPEKENLLEVPLWELFKRFWK